MSVSDDDDAAGVVRLWVLPVPCQRSPAPACEQKRACGRKIKKCAKKERKKPWKRLKCSKKWGKDADGACTNPKTQRKCPKSCGLCG